jgi:uncharacterized protein (UPF0332 family)
LSPRSKEFLDQARECLRAAAALLDQGLATRSVHESYFAMLYAARASLSERDESAKTHRGTWHLFRAAFVEGGEFPTELYGRAQRAQTMREGADYDAAPLSAEEAEALHQDAARFVDAVAEMVGD